MAFSGTLVTSGNGIGVVVGTGARTELGRVSALLETVHPLATPLLRQMNAFGRQLTFVIAALAAAVFAFALLVRGYPLARSEEHTSELQSLMRISYAVFCLKKKKTSQQ